MLYIPKEEHDYLLFFDIEFDKTKLVQFAAILFKKIKSNTYIAYRRINVYNNDIVSYPFSQYTGLTNEFLIENGVRIEDMVSLIEDDFLQGINKHKVLFISHGFKNDAKILLINHINFIRDENGLFDFYCTFEKARKILKRVNHLKLEDIAYECVCYPYGQHNAMRDTDIVVSVYEYLKELE